MFKIFCIFAILVSRNTFEARTVSLGLSEYSYHESFGIPEARRIKTAEEAEFTNVVTTDVENSRIVGGSYATLGQFPYMGGVLITLTTNFTSVCGSSLISETKAVTAAVCWWDGTHQARDFLLVFGSLTLFYGGTRIRTIDVVTHEDWDPVGIQSNLVNNVAIVGFRRVFYTNAINSIALPWTTSNYEQWMVLVAGYGRQSDSHPGIFATQRLHYTILQVINNDDCFRWWGSSVNADSICTNGSDRRSICSGDAGSPLTTHMGGIDILIGIASFGWAFGCETGWPGVFTKVDSFVPWIETHM